MHRAVVSSLALLLLLAPASTTSAQPPEIEQPKEGGIFRVNPATGALTALEGIWSKVQNAGYSYFCYLPGAASPVSFTTGERVLFAVRLLGPPTLEEAQKKPLYKLERLAVKDGKRYGTKQFVPLQFVRTYGEVVHGLDRTKKNRGAQPSLFTPGAQLPPGEYAFTIGGVITPFAGFGADPTFAEAFRIVDGPPPAPPQPAPAPPAQPAAPPTAPQPAPPLAPADLAQWKAAAERGDVAAQYRLGYAYVTGKSVPQDYEQALGWFRKAADLGSIDAQYSLGVMYRDAMGVPEDYARAFELFRQAAERGDAASQVNLGALYYVGKGAPQDYIEAHKWLNLGGAGLTGDQQKRALDVRTEVAALMTPEQIAEAQKRAREWMAAHAK